MNSATNIKPAAKAAYYAIIIKHGIVQRALRAPTVTAISKAVIAARGFGAGIMIERCDKAEALAAPFIEDCCPICGHILIEDFDCSECAEDEDEE